MSMIQRATVFAIALFLVIIAQAGDAVAQAVHSHKFSGILDVKVERLRLFLQVDQDANGRLSGYMISPDQGDSKVEFDRVTLNDKGLSFEIKKVAVEYEGTFSDDQKTIDGKFKQGGRTTNVEFKLVASFPTSKHVQTWTGILDAGSKTFDFQLRIFEESGGIRVGRLDSFDEQIANLYAPLDESDGFKFKIPVSRRSTTVNSATMARPLRARGNSGALNCHWNSKRFHLPIRAFSNAIVRKRQSLLLTTIRSTLKLNRTNMMTSCLLEH